MALVLKFIPNRPRCAKKAAQQTDFAANLARRIDAIGRVRPEAVVVIEDFVQNYERKLDIAVAR